MKVGTPWLIAGGVAAVALVGVGVVLLAPGKPQPTARRTIDKLEPVAAEPDKTAEVPFAYASKTAQAVVSLKLPASLAAQPDLHARLYDEGVKDLKRFADGAASAHAEDTEDTVPYERNVKWTAADETSKLISLQKETFEFSGGAHPNTTLEAVLWDKALKKALQPGALFKTGVDYSKLDATLCDAITAAKKARLGTSFVAAGPDTWQCPKWKDSTLALAPSTVAGKAGGLTFLFSPYAVGAYVEGPYEITVPQSAFRADLAPGYADEFAGSPTKTGDVTPMH
jgi:hypothetical protein